MAKTPLTVFSASERQELSNQDLGGRLLVRSDLDRNDKVIITDDFIKVSHLVQIDDFLIRLETGKLSFEFERIPNQQNGHRFTFSEDIGTLMTYVNIAGRYPNKFNTLEDQLYPILNPRISCFYEVFKDLKESLERTGENQYRCFIPHDMPLVFSLLIKNYIELIHCKEMSNVLSHWRSTYRKNTRSLMDYVDAKLAKHETLYAVHLDLGYDLINKPSITSDYSRMRSDVSKLLSSRFYDKHFRDDLVGHIWKVEYMDIYKFHTRLFLFFKGSTHLLHQNDASMLGDRWINDITHREGAIFSRVSRDNKLLLMPENNGMLISHSIPGSVESLKRYLDFLLQVENLFGIKGQSNKVFGKGQMPKV